MRHGNSKDLDQFTHRLNAVINKVLRDSRSVEDADSANVEAGGFVERGEDLLELDRAFDGVLALRFVRPMTWPVFMPPPASIAHDTCGQ